MYVPTLLESKRRANKGKLLGVGFASLTIHTAVIAGVVYATLHASQPDNTVKMDTTVVLLRAIIDTAGRVEPTSLKIVQSPSPGFDEPTKQWALKALFRPARLHGRAVRSYVNLPFDYSLGS